MSDEALRQHQRRLLQSGSAADEASYLLALSRAGRLELRALELAAYLGHPPALDVCAGSAVAPRDPRAWICGLERYGSDLAVWAAVEAALVDDPGGVGLYSVLRGEARERVRTGALPRSSPQAPLGTSGGPPGRYAKLLRLALAELAQDPRYLPLDHPEALTALQRAAERFPILFAERWAYDRVERSPSGGWVHVLRYPRAGGETRHTLPASPGWVPPGEFRCPPRGRRGVFANYTFGFSSAGIEQARRALLPWALQALPAEPD